MSRGRTWEPLSEIERPYLQRSMQLARKTTIKGDFMFHSNAIGGSQQGFEGVLPQSKDFGN